MDHHHTGVTNGGALALVGPDAVGHECVVLPKAVLVVCLPILAALGVQLLHPGDLVGALGQVGLDVQPSCRRDAAQLGHEPVGA